MFLRKLVLLLALVSFAQGADSNESWPAKPNKPILQVNYSGRFFGYFRYPNVLRKDMQGCRANASSGPSPASIFAQIYESQMGRKKGGEIRLAMGDNFAPELLSRELLDPTTKDSTKKGEPVFRPRDLYSPKYSDKNKPEEVYWQYDEDPKDIREKGFLYTPLHDRIPSDNVSCFLQQLEFDATVPGKDDFYFGPERLAAIARFLRKAHLSDRQPTEMLQPTQMLGANLLVSTSRSNPARSIGCPYCGELPVKASIPKDVLPWITGIEGDAEADPAMEDVSKKDAPKKVALNGYLCNDIPPSLEDFRFNVANCGPPLQALAGEENKRFYSFCPTTSGQETPKAKTDKLCQKDFTLVPNSNHAFCLVRKDKPLVGDYKCFPFTVRQPLFQTTALKPDTDDGSDPYLRDPFSLNECASSPCRLDSDSPGLYAAPKDRDTVIFGVVDADLTKQIGALNDSWNNSKKQYQTAIKVSDPVEALDQVLAYCALQEDCKSKAHKILLAQTTLQKARSIIAKLYQIRRTDVFDMVITQVDAVESTGNVTQSRTFDREAPKTIFVVPAPHYDLPLEANDFSIRIQRATLSQDPASPSTIFLSNSVSTTNITPVMSDDNREAYCRLIVSFSKDVLEEKRAQDEPDCSKQRTKSDMARTTKILSEKTEMDLQKQFSTDVAILQPRDIFSDFEKASALWLTTETGIAKALYTESKLLDEILWKGDFAAKLTVSGADLLKALEQSKAAPADTSLSTLGALADEIHGTYIVHGQEIDPKATYSIATTDYIQFGDTGYPDLKGADVPPVPNIQDVNGERPLLVADIASHFSLHPPEQINPRNPDFLDGITTQSADLSKGFDNARKVQEWFTRWLVADKYGPLLFAKAKPAQNSPNGSEIKAEHISRSYLYLEKFNFSDSLTSIGGPQQRVPTRFGGITNVPQLQTLESQSVAIWERARFGHEFTKYLDVFDVLETRYSFSRNRQRASATTFYDPYQVSIAENAIQDETGILSKPIAKNFPVRLLLSERLVTELRRPLLSYSAPASQEGKLASPSNCNVTSIDVSPPVTSSSAASILCSVPRNVLQQTKLGVRFENGSSWLETGYEIGHNFGSTTGYVFNENTVQQLTCSATTNVSLTACVTSDKLQRVGYLSALEVQHQTLPVSGWFANFKVTVPFVPNKLQLGLENYLEVFSKHAQDTSTDTRYYEDAILSLSFKFSQNFSFAPQVELFDYQNKLIPNHFLSLTSKVVLDYNFDWHYGTSWKRALLFPDPGTITKSTILPPP